MYLRPPTVVGILDRLEGKGLVTRTLSKADRRVVDIDLTAQGSELVANAPEVAQDMLMKGLDELSDEQFTSVEEGMKLMAKVLAADQLIPQPLHS
jgi:DNA-binding MarR family transcriptional regulator